MKTVLGSVMSTKAVSLSKAARILSKFASSDNGASPAFSAYLKRASASFDELVQLHKAFKGFGSERKGKKRHLSSGIVNEETANSVKRSNEDQLFTDERKKLKGGNAGEGEATKLDDEKQRHKKRRDEGEGSVGMRIEVQNSEGIVDKKSKKKNSASDLANVDNVMAVDGVKGESESQNKDSDTKKRKNKDKDEKDHSVGPVKIENEEQVNRKTSEIENQNGHEETKKKKRDKYEKGKLDGAVKVENEEQGYPLGQNREATEFVENDGNEQKKHNKKRKKGKEEKDVIVAGDAEQRNQSDGGDGNVHEVSKHVKVESGEGKKHKKKRNHENKERESGKMVDVKETNEKESRKRKHEEDGHVQFDDTEEKHRAKKKKKTGVDY